MVKNKWEASPERPPPRNETWMSDLPVWLRASILLGVPSVIALFLVYVGATYAPQILAEVKAIHADQVEIRKAHEELKKQNDQILRSIQMYCVAIGKTEVDRLNCFKE